MPHDAAAAVPERKGHKPDQTADKSSLFHTGQFSAAADKIVESFRVPRLDCSSAYKAAASTRKLLGLAQASRWADGDSYNSSNTVPLPGSCENKRLNNWAGNRSETLGFQTRSGCSEGWTEKF